MELKRVGEPLSAFKAKTYTLYKKIPLRLTVSDESFNTSEKVDEDLIGIVIERGGKYILMNVFDD